MIMLCFYKFETQISVQVLAVWVAQKSAEQNWVDSFLYILIGHLGSGLGGDIDAVTFWLRSSSIDVKEAAQHVVISEICSNERVS